MGKITSALKKAADDRLQRIEKINKIKEQDQIVVKKMGSSQIDPRLIAYFDPKALITEQYKILRTNFLSLNKGRPPKTVVVTSALHSEGKTVTTLNLAIAMAQTIKRPKILLIDADMRRGRVARYLGVEQALGLSEVLTGQATPAQTLFNIDLENLTFLSSGSIPPNPTELLSSQDMKDLIDEVRNKYDYIFIDTPPIIPVTDSGILGALADAVIMVIQAGRTQRGVVKRGNELLQQAHAHLIGHVLTNIEYHLPEYIYRYL